MGTFAMKKDKKDADLHLKIEGNIDEEAAFETPDLGDVKKIMIDLDKVTAINSVGIREWIKWTKSLGEGKAIEIHNCPKIVVDQVNMVSGFLPKGAEMHSFYVPYYSEDSGEERMILFKRGEHYNGAEVKAPTDIKDSDGGAMEMDVIEAKYFKFLANG